jgi:hypothetical protein
MKTESPNFSVERMAAGGTPLRIRKGVADSERGRKGVGKGSVKTIDTPSSPTINTSGCLSAISKEGAVQTFDTLRRPARNATTGDLSFAFAWLGC